MEKGAVYIKSIKDSNPSDFASMVKEIYSDSPEAMLFNSNPSEKELEELFNAKVTESGAGRAIDLVAEAGGRLVGECEIVRISHSSAVVGIIVRKEARGLGVSDLLLERAAEKARALGISELIAEVMGGNSRAVSFFARSGFRKEGISGKIVRMSRKG